MIGAPKTLKEARNYHYGEWAGNPRGDKYIEGQCAYEILKGWIPTQCKKNNGYGPGWLYYKVHASKVK